MPTVRYSSYKAQQLLCDRPSSLLILAEDMATSAEIVVKRPKAGCAQIHRELTILPTLSHPGIVKLLGVAESAYGDCAIFPYAADGDLFGLIESEALSESAVKKIVFQILEALAYLHSKAVWHRDIKPENILVINRDTFQIVITDFGCAVQAQGGARRDGFEGTTGFSAPELIVHGWYSEKVDIWAVGVTMFIMLTRYHPFDVGQDIDQLDADILYNGFENLETPDGVSEDAMDFMRRLMANCPDDRPDAEDALNDPWFDNVDDKDLEMAQQEAQSQQGVGVQMRAA
jgi:serine/threonine protein kinase